MKDIINILLSEANKALTTSDVPVSSAILDKDNNIISIARNEKEHLKDPTAHAEIIAIQKASSKLNTWRLDDCKIITTLEPCSMCYYAILNARISEIIYLSKDSKFGFLNGNINHYEISNKKTKPRLIYREEKKASQLIKSFFKKLR